MQKIFKYLLPLTPLNTISLPSGFKVLSVQIQHGNICMWVQLDPGAKHVMTQIAILATGETFPRGYDGCYAGTVLSPNGMEVYHIFYSSVETTEQEVEDVKFEIYERKVALTANQIQTLPKGSTVLNVYVRDNELYLVVKARTKETGTEVLTLMILGTGEPFSKDFKGEYINTFQLDGGAYVFHAFYRK